MDSSARGNEGAVVGDARARVTLVLALLAAIACSSGDDERVVPPRKTAVPQRYAVETVAKGLEVPWGIAFAPDGRIFVTERAGSIRVIRDGTLDPAPWATLPVAAAGEAGLMGIAVAPDFEMSKAVFVAATFREGEDLVNRVLRLTERNGRGAAPQIVIDRIPAARFHAGDAIAFAPDGTLFIATGDATDPGEARKMESLAGKILRYRPDGGIPSDNPFPNSPVYALGLRNVQGIAWSRDGQLFATDHGPSGFPNERFRRNHDELNAIRPGANYGWPDAAGMGGAPRFMDPLVEWNEPGIAPAGLAWLEGPRFPGWSGSLFVGALKGTQLRRITVRRDSVAQSGWSVVSDDIVLDSVGRIRAVVAGPDGMLYLTTSNQDGRGSPLPGDDRVLRIVPLK